VPIRSRIAFPFELKLTNTAESAVDPDREYQLFAVVVHVGAGASHGHYVSLVRSHHHWLLFDDDTVELVEEASIQSCFGSAVESSGSTETGYILFYQATTWDGEAGNLGSEESSLRNLSRVYGDAPAQLDGERNGRQAPSRMEGSSASSHEDSVVSSMSVVSP